MIPDYLDLYLNLELNNRKDLDNTMSRHIIYIKGIVLAIMYEYLKNVFGLTFLKGYFVIPKNRNRRAILKKGSLSTKHRISKQADIMEFLRDIDNKSFIFGEQEFIFQPDIYKDRFCIDIAVIYKGGPTLE